MFYSFKLHGVIANGVIVGGVWGRGKWSTWLMHSKQAITLVYPAILYATQWLLQFTHKLTCWASKDHLANLPYNKLQTQPAMHNKH